MVTLRHFGKEDAKFIHNSMYPDMAMADISDMIDEWNSLLYQGHYFEMFAVISGGQIVGSVSLREQSRSIVSAGIDILDSERGKGLGSEAFSLLIQHASGNGYRIILDQVRKDNTASIRLHEKLGFESDGYVYRNRKDHEVVLYLKVL